MKLEPWGIEIYAAIDAYSRHIVWIYVGITARTQISTLYQYREALKTTYKRPWKIRSDRGTETTMLGDCHLALCKKNDSDIKFDDVYIYGTSTKNQRIEQWWQHLTASQTNPWIVSYLAKYLKS
jgi:hypothetical protein